MSRLVKKSGAGATSNETFAVDARQSRLQLTERACGI